MQFQHILAVRSGNPSKGHGIAETYHHEAIDGIRFEDKIETYPPTHGKAEDADFIAHARQDIPYLLRRLEESEKVVTQMRMIETDTRPDGCMADQAVHEVANDALTAYDSFCRGEGA